MSREQILARVRAALAGRTPLDHPVASSPSSEGADPSRPERPRSSAGSGDRDVAVSTFVASFERGGGETVRRARADVPAWLRAFVGESGTCVVGAEARAWLGGDLGLPSTDDASRAAVGISRAHAAIADTGSLALSSRGGRAPQLLPPTHVVLVDEADVHATLTGWLARAGTDLPAAYGLHSGPSRSADIGRVMVRGVHGPGRVIALLTRAGGRP